MQSTQCAGTCKGSHTTGAILECRGLGVGAIGQIQIQRGGGTKG